jgi:AcrR family transcriptional regulator|tara:strand:+ start:524 stop:1048 length:525 start_codon:yes stop_codon:yes gene_type:complete
MIVEGGLQRFTMEALACTAGVTTPLVYNYFSGRQALLKSLLVQEYESYWLKTVAEVGAAKSFDDVVRAYVTSNFDHHAPGSILLILQSQPEIVELIERHLKKDRQQAAEFVAQSTAKSFKLTKSQAELVASMSSGSSIAAAQYAGRVRVNREKTIDNVLAYVLAGISAIVKKIK